jgi:hypothetical protein
MLAPSRLSLTHLVSGYYGGAAKCSKLLCAIGNLHLSPFRLRSVNHRERQA